MKWSVFISYWQVPSSYLSLSTECIVGGTYCDDNNPFYTCCW